MTSFVNRTIRQAGLALAVAASFSALSSSASFAFSAEAQQMCTGDAFRLCSSACMVKNRSNLSTGCRAVMDKDMAEKAGKVASK